MNHNMKKSYVMIHVIKHDIDPNMDLNYSRKIGPPTNNTKTINKNARDQKS